MSRSATRSVSVNEYFKGKMAGVDPFLWSVDQVIDQLCSWDSSLYRDQLTEIKHNFDLDELASSIRSNDVDGDTLLSLEDGNIKDDLGVSSLGQRRQLTKVVQYLREISAVFAESQNKAILKRHRESDDGQKEAEQDTHEPQPEAKKRRIQPELLSVKPISAPADFDPGDLTEIERAFLERHQEPFDTESLRPYNESDSELEVMSDDSLLDDLDSGDETPPPSKLSSEQIYRIVDDTVEEFRRLWVANKQPRKHKKAFDRWMSAARAGTRRPQQNALEAQIATFQARLDKFRKGIHDMGREFNKVEDIKQICVNLQVTIEAIAEHEYYLQVLESDQPPPSPHPLPPPVQALPEDLANDEEILESESERESSEEEEVDFLDQASNSGSDVSLMYDPTDDDWKPQLPVEAVPNRAESRTEHKGPSNTSPEFQQEPVRSQTVTPPRQTASPPMDIISPVPYPLLPAPKLVQTNGRLPTLLKTRQDTPNLPQIVQNSIEDQMDEEPEIDLFEERLPQSRYLSQGTTLDNAIDLGSSPASSEFSMAGSIHTPPINPESPTKYTGPLKPLSPQFPAIQETRSMKYKDIGKDVFLLLCKSVYKRSRDVARDVLEKIKNYDPKQVVSALQAIICEWQDSMDGDDSMDAYDDDVEFLWTYFYIVFATGSYAKQVWDVSEKSLDEAFDLAPTLALKFDKTLRPLLRYYIETETNQSGHYNKGSLSDQHGKWLKQTTDSFAGRSATVSTFVNGSKRSPTPVTDTESDLDLVPASSQKRKRHVQQSQEALKRQREDRDRVEAQEEQRRQLMMQKFQAVASDDDVTSIPINTEEPIVYLDKHIARRVKPHQIEGIQFIWRELVSDPAHQGCLLAHTMGLGKTMQVVSFLVTLAQANMDPGLTQHLPTHLRSNKVLVVCPASLVDNWHDEILMWTPPKSAILGTIYRIQGTRRQKVDTVTAWNQKPGVLIVGYESLRAMLRKTTDMSNEEHQYLEKSLLEDPCVVIADEAHKLKNTKSAVNKVAMQVATSSRIALTGSPLNNHLEEYHTMINWIAPDYLGTLTQFKAKYSEPIERGLYADSSRYDKRKSLEKLYVLKRDLAPKISRKDISAIAKDMPQKTEFFITVPLTRLQIKIYRTMVEHFLRSVGSNSGGVPKSTNAQLWVWLSILSWLCNHPSCLIRKLEEKDPEGAQAANASIANLESLGDGEFDESTLPDNFNVTESPISGLLPQFLNYFSEIERFNNREDPALSMRSEVTRLLIRETIAQGEKILIFSHSIPTLDFLQGMVFDMGHECMRIDGSTKTDQRQNATKFFNDQNSNTSVFLISTRAGGLGLNLQGATRVIIYDFGFNPSWEEQAIGRAYRLGQKKPVFVYRFRAGGTFEENMYNKAIFKTQLFSRVVDQKNVIRHASKKIEDYLFVPKEAEKQDLSECLGKDALLDKIVQQIPDAIRGLILTETFQREDEDDEMTPEEKRNAEEAYRLEKLARNDPAAYRQALVAREQAQRVERMRYQEVASGFGTQKTTFEQVWNGKTLNAAGPTPRPTQQAVDEGFEILESKSLSSKESSTAPGCSNQ